MAGSRPLTSYEQTDMNPEIETAIRAHAVAEYPRECCGLVIKEGGREVYLRCRNVAAGGRQGDHFVMAKADYFAAADRGDLLALVHSHPDMPARPTQADRVSCEASGITWFIVRVDGADGSVETGEIEELSPSGYRAPLEGREFYHGVLDCYALVRDWFEQERGVTLPDFVRRDNWWGDGSGEDLYMKYFRSAGFEPVELEDLQVGDCFLMQVRAKVVNHAAVYVGDGKILHHLYGRPSRHDIYGGYWRDVTRLVVRYRGT